MGAAVESALIEGVIKGDGAEAVDFDSGFLWVFADFQEAACLWVKGVISQQAMVFNFIKL